MCVCICVCIYIYIYIYIYIPGKTPAGCRPGCSRPLCRTVPSECWRTVSTCTTHVLYYDGVLPLSIYQSKGTLERSLHFTDTGIADQPNVIGETSIVFFVQKGPYGPHKAICIRKISIERKLPFVILTNLYGPKISRTVNY